MLPYVLLSTAAAPSLDRTLAVWHEYEDEAILTDLTWTGKIVVDFNTPLLPTNTYKEGSMLILPLVILNLSFECKIIDFGPNYGNARYIGLMDFICL